jgi:hypothetical protein
MGFAHRDRESSLRILRGGFECRMPLTDMPGNQVYSFRRLFRSTLIPFVMMAVAVRDE